MQTKISRDLHGSWRGDTRIHLNDSQILRISTHKTYSGALVSSATVHKIENGFETHLMYGDYSQTIIARKVRVTQNAVKAQHDMALEKLESIKESIAAHYSAKAAA